MSIPDGEGAAPPARCWVERWPAASKLATAYWPSLLGPGALEPLSSYVREKGQKEVGGSVFFVLFAQRDAWFRSRGRAGMVELLAAGVRSL